jgi:hypothetical protein
VGASDVWEGKFCCAHWRGQWRRLHACANAPTICPCAGFGVFEKFKVERKKKPSDAEAEGKLPTKAGARSADCAECKPKGPNQQKYPTKR